jgi:hypothetical protein
MNKTDGGPAFPHVAELVRVDENMVSTRQITDGGMSLRDYFAAKAMHAMLNTELRKDAWASVEAISKDAYKQADAMLAAREK